MGVFSFPLSASPHIRVISLRELNGHDELLSNVESSGVLKFLNNIIIQPPHSESQNSLLAEKISVADRDFLLASIYQYTYGPRISSSLPCNACGELYDLNFSLKDFISSGERSMSDLSVDNEGLFCTEKGIRFRLPNGEDEIYVRGMPADKAADEILSRCIAQPVADEDMTALIETMEQVAPVLVTDIDIRCPECQQMQKVQFDMQSFLLATVKNERKKVCAEIHSIAMAYGWSHKEILDLPRSLRQAYVSMIGLN
ncbi:MAG: hypothetical protein ABIN36_09685 [Ferruginibacter sp.]